MNGSIPGQSRNGFVLVAVLVVVILAGFLCLHMAQSIVRGYHVTRLHRDLTQCQLLADAGIARAFAMAANDGRYREETWSIAVGELSAGQAGSVQIEVQRQQDAQNKIESISVTARYPADGPRSLAVTRTWPVP